MKSKTIGEVSCLWKKDKKRYVRESTYATYVLILDNYILPVFGQCETPMESDIQDYVLEMLGEGLSRRSIMGILVVLKMVSGMECTSDATGHQIGESSFRLHVKKTKLPY